MLTATREEYHDRQEKVHRFSTRPDGSLETRNRLIRSATYENAATASGEVTEHLLDMYRALARGGVGVIITGASSVHPDGLPPPRMFRADNDSFIPSLRRIPEAVHGVENGCKVILQLNHSGRQVRSPGMELIAVPPLLAAVLQREQATLPAPPGHHPEVKLILEPDLPDRWLSGQGGETARCISCNACLPIGPEPLFCRAMKG